MNNAIGATRSAKVRKLLSAGLAVWLGSTLVAACSGSGTSGGGNLNGGDATEDGVSSGGTSGGSSGAGSSTSGSSGTASSGASGSSGAASSSGAGSTSGGSSGTSGSSGADAAQDSTTSSSGASSSSGGSSGSSSSAGSSGSSSGTASSSSGSSASSSSSSSGASSSSGSSASSSSGSSSGTSSGSSASSSSSSGAGSSSGSSSSSGGSSASSSSGGSSSSSGGADASCGSCGVGHDCVGGSCVPCGTQGVHCCNGTFCSTNLTCSQGTCSCGGPGEACCSGTSCNSSLQCISGTCACGGAGQTCCPASTGLAACSGTLACAGSNCTCLKACSGNMVQRSDGTLWIWGSPPTEVTLTGGTTPFVAGSGAFSEASSTSLSSSSGGLGCAIRSSDGTVWCWGSNNYGQLGNAGVGTSSATPVEVATNAPGTTYLMNMTNVWVDGYYGDTACAINASGAVWCWGYGGTGALGNGSTSANSNFAIPVKTSAGGAQLSGVAQLSVNSDHVCGVKTDHTLVCWGSNSYGQIGQGTDNTTNSYYLYPTTVSALFNQVAQVSVSSGASCATDLSGGVWCWGYDYYGITGNGVHTGNAKVPVQVQAVAGDGGAPFSGVSKVYLDSYAYYTACAELAADGSIWCWGNYSSSNGYVPIPYIQNSNQVSAVYDFCENGQSYPSFIDYKGQFNYNSSTATTTYAVTCP